MRSVKTWPWLIAGMMLCVAGEAFASGRPCPADLPMHLELPVTRSALAGGKPITIVALGSSSTEGAGASSPDRTYPARLEALLQDSWPGANVTTLNRGVGGQTLDAVLSRLETDVISVRPTLVIWQVGTNEAIRAMDPARFDELLDQGLRRLATTGADIVLMDYQIAPRLPPDDKLEVYGAIIAREARAHGVPLYSRAALMRSWQAADPTTTDMIGPDGLHHSDRGYACLAASLDTAIAAGAAPRITVVNAKAK